jgi:predicted cupin superfamily sugar epimerase
MTNAKTTTDKARAQPSAREVIELLGLEPHPAEGGFFRETYRSAEELAAAHLPARYGAARSQATAIYYLLTPETFSAMHLLATDEIFHHYLGGPVRMLQLAPDGSGRELLLGPDLAAGQRPQVLVPRGAWQGARLESGSFALLGCTVSPGFDFADYTHGERGALQAGWPAHAGMIELLTTP